jgi:hypothetical protein
MPEHRGLEQAHHERAIGLEVDAEAALAGAKDARFHARATLGGRA